MHRCAKITKTKWTSTGNGFLVKWTSRRPGLCPLARRSRHQWWKSRNSASDRCTAKPLAADQMFRLMGRVRSDLAEVSHLLVLPPFLIAGQPYSIWIKKRLAGWALEDAQHYAKPRVERVWLTGEDIENFCIDVLGGFITGSEPSDWLLCGALIARLQCASNLRAGNLEKDVLWKHIDASGHEGHYGSIEIISTKMLSGARRDIGEVVSASPRVPMIRHEPLIPTKGPFLDLGRWPKSL